MLSIASVSSAQAVQYYSEKDNYYANEAGYWKGKGAEALGLEGEVNKDDFLNLLEGKDLNGKQVVQSGVGDHKGERRAAIDLTFSAPKSVSILAEVIGDGKGREVVEAHNMAVSATLEYIEGHYAQARQYEEGRVKRVDTGNLLIGVFRHDLSRELDPQLHTHAVVINQTVREDGKTVATEYKEMFDNKLFLGQMYRNELAKKLTGLGYGITRNEKGFFEINGIDRELIDAFSKRSGQINHEVARLKESGTYENAGESRLREIAGLGSRTPKHEVSIETVKEGWEGQLKEMDFSRAGIMMDIETASESFRNGKMHQSGPPMNEYDYVRSAAGIITEQESAFSKESLLRTAGTLSMGEYRVADLEKAFHDLIKDREIMLLHEKLNIYTTQQMYRLEASIMEKIRDGNGAFLPVMAKEKIQQAIVQRYSDLTGDQKRAVEHILSSKDFVSGVQGSAGTGKTTMLRAVNNEAVNQGVHVRGLAFTGKAAEELQEGSGIESQTIHSFLMTGALEPESRELWIIDEASMLGSRQVHELLERATGGTVQMVLVGDIKQLQAIDAGPIFNRLQSSNTMNTAHMNDIVRQENGYMRDIATLIQERNRIDSAMSRMSERGRIQEIQNRDERLSAITKDYVSGDTCSRSLIITGTNRDRNDINHTIREELKTLGKLKGDEHTFTVRESRSIRPEEKRFAHSYQEGDLLYARKAGVMGRAGTEARVINVDYTVHSITAKTGTDRKYTIDLMKDGDKISAYAEKDRQFMKGDFIVLTKNDKRLGVKNGVRGEIRSLNERGEMIVRLVNGREVGFNTNDYSYIDSAYAVTSYKGQGQSVDKVYYHADTTKRVDYNEFYVAITRSRKDVHIYTNDKEALKEQAKENREKTFSQDYKDEQKAMDTEKNDGREKENGHDAKGRDAGHKESYLEGALSYYDTEEDNGRGRESEDPETGKHESETERSYVNDSEREGELSI